jgi:hypothetical protein
MKKEVAQMKVYKSTNKSALSLFSIVVVLALALGGCAPVRALSRPKATAPEDHGEIYESVAQQNVMAIEVVQSFYDWYLSYPGNVVAEGAYRSSEHLTEPFIEKVDEIVASFERGGYDPFLCAQDIPGDLLVGDEVTRSGDAATIVVQKVWNPGTEYESTNDAVVELQMMDGEWKISDIVCK